VLLMTKRGWEYMVASAATKVQAPVKDGAAAAASSSAAATGSTHLAKTLN